MTMIRIGTWLKVVLPMEVTMVVGVTMVTMVVGMEAEEQFLEVALHIF